MRKIALALAVALSMMLVPVANAGASGPVAGGDAEIAKKKKKCKKGYKRVTKKVKRRGKTVRVKVCRKAKKKKPAAGKPPAGQLPVGIPSVYSGFAYSVDRSFRYGKVTINRAGSQVTRVEIKDVTASCDFPSGLRVLVFNPATPGQQILSGSGAIAGGRMTVKFRPVADVDDVIDLSITFSGRTATGAFMEAGVCDDRGVFTATG